jgi:hypothetical protein
MYFILFIIILITIFILVNSGIENFTNCEKLPTGPYLSSCSNYIFNNNILTAYCVGRRNYKYFSRLDLSGCEFIFLKIINFIILS